MYKSVLERREFLKSMLAGIPVLALDWESLPRGGRRSQGDDYDAIIIGAGLGGLSCGAAFARQGFKTLVLEQHRIPGGYASSFKRPGGFTFDVSLHSTTVGLRDGVANLISGFPEIKDLTFVPHKTLYRAIYPDYDIRVPHMDIEGYIKILKENFPQDADGIDGIFADMKGFTDDLNRYQQAGGQVNMSSFPKDFPFLFKNFNRTWGAMLEDRVQNPKLKAVISGLWGYFGLPPSKLSAFYYAMPLIGYLEGGGYYPEGTSQKISDAFSGLITGNGGEVKLNTRVIKILTKDHSAIGVRAEDGKEYRAKVVISNANAVDTFKRMMGDEEKDVLKDYLSRMDGFSVSYSSFQIWLGLKKDLVKETGLKESEIFYYTDYDVEKEYTSIMAGDMSNTGFGLTVYDNLFDTYSPKGKNTLNIIATQGFSPWEKYEKDYFAGRKESYRKEKNRIADILIDRVEAALLPGLREAVEVREVATPLTNVRFTSNYRGAIYGWDQTVDNSGNRRIQHHTPINNLYLAGAWTFPGGGYGACIPSGLMCFSRVMEDWKK